MKLSQYAVVLAGPFSFASAGKDQPYRAPYDACKVALQGDSHGYNVAYAQLFGLQAELGTTLAELGRCQGQGDFGYIGPEPQETNIDFLQFENTMDHLLDKRHHDYGPMLTQCQNWRIEQDSQTAAVRGNMAAIQAKLNDAEMRLGQCQGENSSAKRDTNGTLPVGTESLVSLEQIMDSLRKNLYMAQAGLARTQDELVDTHAELVDTRAELADTQNVFRVVEEAQASCEVELSTRLAETLETNRTSPARHLSRRGKGGKQAQIDNLSGRLSVVSADVARAEGDTARVLAELTSCREDYGDALGSGMTDKRARDALTRYNTQLQDNVRTLEAALQIEKGRRRDADSSLIKCSTLGEANNEDRAGLEARLGACDKQTVAAGADLRTATDHLGDTQKDLQRALTDNSKAQGNAHSEALTTCNTDKYALQVKADTCAQGLADANEAKTDVNGQLTTCTYDKNALQEKLKICTNDLSTAKDTKVDVNGDLTTCQTQRDDFQRQAQQCIPDVAATKIDRDATKDKLQQCDGNLDTATKGLQHFQDQLEAQNRCVERINTAYLCPRLN